MISADTMSPGLAPFDVVLVDEDVLGDPGIGRRHEAVGRHPGLGQFEGADDLGMRPLEDADDHAFPFAFLLFPSVRRRRYAGHDLVAVHGVEPALERR